MPMGGLLADSYSRGSCTTTTADMCMRVKQSVSDPKQETAPHLDGHAALPHGLQVSTQQATVTLALANGLHAVVVCHTKRHCLHVAKPHAHKLHAMFACTAWVLGGVLRL